MAYCTQCGVSIEIIPAHRSRHYCSNTCKQAAYRRRQGMQPRKTKSTLDMMKNYSNIKRFEEEYPHLGFRSYCLLNDIQKKQGRHLADTIAETIIWEVQRVKNQS